MDLDEKKHRKRTKKLLNSIQEQLDFYFSDANLRHDRFLRKQIEDNEGGYIALETMLEFNQLKQFGTEISMLVKAVENSTTLQLDESKTKVKRFIPLPTVDNTKVDSKTVYVEQLQAYCDHTWIKQVFSTCGVVDYISLPRYKHNNKIKGFAFVEFSLPEEAEKACRILNTAEVPKVKVKKRNSTETNEQISTTPSKTRRKRSVSFSEPESDTTHVYKRRRSVSECSEDTPSKLKRKRKSSLEDRPLSEIKDKASHDILNNSSSKTETDNKTDTVKAGSLVKKTKKNTKDPIDKSNNEDKVKGNEEDDDKESKKKKKNRNHSRKDKQQKEISVPPLYVISKNEWITLKRQYKHLQKKEFEKLKQTMRVLKSEKVRRKELKEMYEAELQEENKNTDKKSQPVTLKPGSKRKLDVENDECEPVVKKTQTGKNEKYEMAPGSVALISAIGEGLTKDIIRNSISPYGDIAYIDYLHGSLKGYVRFKGSEMLESALKTANEIKESWQFSIQKLGNKEEEEYFQKAAEDRKKRYEINEKKKKKREERGNSKVLKQAEEYAKKS